MKTHSVDFLSFLCLPKGKANFQYEILVCHLLSLVWSSSSTKSFYLIGSHVFLSDLHKLTDCFLIMKVPSKHWETASYRNCLIYCRLFSLSQIHFILITGNMFGNFGFSFSKSFHSNIFHGIRHTFESETSRGTHLERFLYMYLNKFTSLVSVRKSIPSMF